MPCFSRGTTPCGHLRPYSAGAHAPRAVASRTFLLYVRPRLAGCAEPAPAPAKRARRAAGWRGRDARILLVVDCGGCAAPADALLTARGLPLQATRARRMRSGCGGWTRRWPRCAAPPPRAKRGRPPRCAALSHAVLGRSPQFTPVGGVAGPSAHRELLWLVALMRHGKANEDSSLVFYRNLFDLAWFALLKHAPSGASRQEEGTCQSTSLYNRTEHVGRRWTCRGRQGRAYGVACTHRPARSQRAMRRCVC